MKALLLLLALVLTAFAAPKEKDITPLLTSATWKWDHPSEKGRIFKFKKDGVVDSGTWKGVWVLTSPFHVQITMEATRKFELDFNKEVTAFTGTHPDGFKIEGKRVGEVPSSLK